MKNSGIRDDLPYADVTYLDKDRNPVDCQYAPDRAVYYKLQGASTIHPLEFYDASKQETAPLFKDGKINPRALDNRYNLLNSELPPVGYMVKAQNHLEGLKPLELWVELNGYTGAGFTAFSFATMRNKIELAELYLQYPQLLISSTHIQSVQGISRTHNLLSDCLLMKDVAQSAKLLFTVMDRAGDNLAHAINEVNLIAHTLYKYADPKNNDDPNKNELLGAIDKMLNVEGIDLTTPYILNVKGASKTALEILIGQYPAEFIASNPSLIRLAEKTIAQYNAKGIIVTIDYDAKTVSLDLGTITESEAIEDNIAGTEGYGIESSKEGPVAVGSSSTSNPWLTYPSAHRTLKLEPETIDTTTDGTGADKPIVDIKEKYNPLANVMSTSIYTDATLGGDKALVLTEGLTHEELAATVYTIETIKTETHLDQEERIATTDISILHTDASLEGGDTSYITKDSIPLAENSFPPVITSSSYSLTSNVISDTANNPTSANTDTTEDDKVGGPSEVRGTNDPLFTWQFMIHSASAVCKYSKILDTAVDISKLLHIPTLDNAKKVLIDTSYIYSMHTGVNGYSALITGGDIAYKIYNGEYSEALEQFQTSVSYMLLPTAVAHIGNPYITFAYVAGITISSAKNAISNAYSLYQEYNSEFFKEKSCSAYEDLFEALSSSPLAHLYDFSQQEWLSGHCKASHAEL